MDERKETPHKLLNALVAVLFARQLFSSQANAIQKKVDTSLPEETSTENSHHSKLEEYKILVDIFKGYLDTALTGNIWFYALTGAIVANFLSYRTDRPYLKYSLIIPFLLSGALALMSGRGIGQAKSLVSANEISSSLGVKGIPPVDILVGFLWITLGLNLLVCIGLILLFIWPKGIFPK